MTPNSNSKQRHTRQLANVIASGHVLTASKSKVKSKCQVKSSHLSSAPSNRSRQSFLFSLSLSLSLSLLPIKLKFKFKLAAHTQTHAGTDTDFGTWQFLTLSPAHALLSPFNQIVKSTSGASHKHGFNVYGRSTSLNLWYSISPMMPKLSLLQNHVWKRLDLFCSCSSWKKKKKNSSSGSHSHATTSLYSFFSDQGSAESGLPEIQSNRGISFFVWPFLCLMFLKSAFFAHRVAGRHTRWSFSFQAAFC